MEEGRRTASAVAILALACASACGSKKKATSASPAGKVLAALLHAADGARVPWRCAALDAPALPAEDLTLGPATWRVDGHSLKRTDPDDELVIGVVADAAGAAPRTIAALGRMRAALEAAKVDLVITLGGMGSDAGRARGDARYARRAGERGPSSRSPAISSR